MANSAMTTLALASNLGCKLGRGADSAAPSLVRAACGVAASLRRLSSVKNPTKIRQPAKNSPPICT
jgi:hypothetical protein